MSRDLFALLCARFGEHAVARGYGHPAATTMQRSPAVAIVSPDSVETVSDVLRFCQEASVDVHPRSGGANWGFGASIPWSTEPSVVLDLARLDRIVQHDERWGVMRVQAGVTFAAAHEYLEREGSKFYLNTIGGSPRGSVLANALERGHGLGLYNDRFGALRRLRVVLPTGELIETDVETDGPVGTHRWGAGPSLRGLFSQSNFGVVVEADTLLAPKPKYWETFTVWMLDPTRLGTVVERMRDAHGRGAVQCSFRSAHRIWSDGGPGFPARTTRVGYPFRGVFFYAGDDADELALHRRRVEKLTRGLGATRWIESSWGPITRRAQTGMPADVELHKNLALRPDAPQEGSVQAMYRVKEAVSEQRPFDLDRDAVGLLWATPIVPMSGPAVLEIATTVEKLALEHDVQPDITFCTVDDWRFMDGILGFAFDAKDPHALARAEKAWGHFDAFARERGYASYRTGIQHAASGVHSPARRELLGRLKRVFDPAGILSRWRTSSE